ncbi:MAG: right-handed parallel beta-helix repeat-containing protein [Phycisphaerae bacterium]|nr:right-handed parallel beta-helix repeat-containing protein [Phycisphaerae bacterium]
MWRTTCLGLVVACVIVAGGRARPGGPASKPAASQPTSASAETVGLIGFAAVAAEGQEGTTGGTGGPEVTVATAEEFLAAIQGDQPRVVRIAGPIVLPAGMHRVGSNKSILGVGGTARFRRGGLAISGASNVIIRNIAFRDATEDAITITDRAHHVWVDHCDLAAAGDGLIDIVCQASYVTVSWCRFSNHLKTMLIGNDPRLTADSGFLKVTLHHNWFDGTEGRHPRVRFGQVHAFNNFYERNSYGIVSNMRAQVVVEGNYFLAVPRPTLIRYRDPEGGELRLRDNVFRGSGRPRATGRAFDPKTCYPYELDKAAQVPGLVRKGAGVGKL